MESVISSLFVVFIFVALIGRGVRKIKSEEQAAVNRQKNFNQAINRGTGTAPSKSPAKSVAVPDKRNAAHTEMYPAKMKDGVKRDAKGGTTIKDDRRNDWLARQMREEKIALYKMAGMFGFKPGTSSINAASLNRDMHARICDSEGVDTAQGK